MPTQAGPPMPRLWRITDRATFVDLRRRGRRVRQGPISLTWIPGEPGTPPRVAFAVGRRVGGAVDRNRLRRRLRASVGELDPPLPPGAYLVGAGPEASRLTATEMRTILESLADAVRT